MCNMAFIWIHAVQMCKMAFIWMTAWLFVKNKIDFYLVACVILWIFVWRQNAFMAFCLLQTRMIFFFIILLFFVVLAYLLAAQLKSGVYKRHLQWVDDKLEIHSFPCLIDSPFGIEPWLRDKFCIMKLQRGNRKLTDSDPLLLP